MLSRPLFAYEYAPILTALSVAIGVYLFPNKPPTTNTNGINTMSALTMEIINTLDDVTLKALAKSPEYKNLVVQVQTARKAEADAEFIAYANAYQNGDLFTVAGREMDFAEVVTVALSNLTFSRKNEDYEAHTQKFAKIYARQGEAWTVLKNIQKGFEAMDVKFALTTEALREAVEATL